MPTIPHVISKVSQPIIDAIDEWPAKHCGFTEEKLDFTINHNTEYRMGNKLNDGEA